MKSLLHFQLGWCAQECTLCVWIITVICQPRSESQCGPEFPTSPFVCALLFTVMVSDWISLSLVLTKELLSPITRRPQHQHVQIQSLRKERGVRVRKLSTGTLSSWGFGAFLEGRSSMSQFQCSNFLVWALLRNPSDSQPTPLQTAEKVLVFSLSHNNTWMYILLKRQQTSCYQCDIMQPMTSPGWIITKSANECTSDASGGVQWVDRRF